jgi:16S rRNA (cytosine967-C5)-methyltransferase
MSRFHSYINSSAQIIQQYNGREPLASFLQTHFRSNKKYGSKDRKTITNLVYSFYRLGGQSDNIPTEEKLLLGLFLTSQVENEILAALKPEWNQLLNDKLDLNSRLKIVKADFPSFDESAFFPWKEELSEGIEILPFRLSHLIQPDLFIRVRPNHWEEVFTRLQTSLPETEFEIVNRQCIALPNSTKLDSIIELNKEAVIQDYSSQRIGEFLQIIKDSTDGSISVWDACAGSGGKSILAKDVLGEIELTVSDIRESILINLQKRFASAQIGDYRTQIVDLASNKYKIENNKFKIVIADVPCTGSGTWGRTPEQLYFFDKEKINEYATKQRKILSNIISSLKPEGYLLYCTCSVFKKENEDNVEWLLKNFPLQLIKKELLVGYEKKADTLFAALFTLNHA